MTYRYTDKPKKHWAKLVEPEEEDRYSSEGFAEGDKIRKEHEAIKEHEHPYWSGKDHS